MNLITKAALFMMVFAIALIAGVQTYTVVHFAQEPFVILKASATNSPVQQSDDLIVRYTADRRTLCKTEADVFVLQEPDQLVLYAFRRPAGVTPPGVASWSVRVPTKDLRPGHYMARFFIHSDCGDRLHSIMVPDIPFEVTSD